MLRATAPFEVVSHSIIVPAQANCTVQCTESHVDPPLDATMVLCINKWWACTKSQYGVRPLSHMHKVWTCSLEATLFTKKLKLSVITVMPNLGSLDLHWIVQVVSLVYFSIFPSIVWWPKLVFEHIWSGEYGHLGSVLGVHNDCGALWVSSPYIFNKVLWTKQERGVLF